MVYSVIQTTVSKFVPSPSKRRVQPESASLSVTVRFFEAVEFPSSFLDTT